MESETSYLAHLNFDLGVARGQKLEEHLEEVAHLASHFSSKVVLPSIGKLEGFLHDFGKYSSDFQSHITSRNNDIVDHSTAGAQIVWETLKDTSPPISRLIAQVIALCIASHHGGLLDCLAPDGEDKFSARMAKSKEETHLNEVQDNADTRILDEAKNLLKSPQLISETRKALERLFAGDTSETVRSFYMGLLARFLFSALVDADRLSAAGRSDINIPHWDILTERLERHISGLKQQNWVDKIRSDVSMACRQFASREKGLFQLTVPTGGGKTLSSLRFALHHAAHHRMDRIIYVLPYITIIDQNASIARLILETNKDEIMGSVILEHHSNLTPDKETMQSRLLTENWDAPIIFTTTIQFLDTLFARGTRGVRKMHRLANAVIIFDEIQTLPVKIIHLFNNAINFLVKQCGATVIFCTATQPLLHAVDAHKGAAKLSDKPEMVTNQDKLFTELRRVNVLDKCKIGGWTEAEVAGLVCDEARLTGSALAIVNTKAEARAVYALCKQQMNNTFHLSANMCPAHRMRVIDYIKKKLDTPEVKSEPLLCISTQLIEAGVDIDFGSVVRYTSGLDSIAQAAGRCNRNGRRTVGNVYVVNPSHEVLAKLPEIEIGKKISERVLDEYRKAPDMFDHDILSPKMMQRYYEYYFFNRAHEMTYKVSGEDTGHADDLLTLLSTNTLAVEAYKRGNKSAPLLQLRQSFKSAAGAFEVIDAPTDGIIIPYDEEGKRIIAKLCATEDMDEIRKLLREAQRYSVNLFPDSMQKLVSTGCIYETRKGNGIFYLDERYYSKEVGIVLENKQLLEFLGI